MRASEEHTRLIVETALDAVITMNGTGVITGWSPRAEVIFGWARAEVMGQPLAQTISAERHREAHRRGLERCLATGKSTMLNRRVKFSAMRRDGFEFPMDLSIAQITTSVAPGFSAFVRDISERKLAEQRLR